MDNLWTVTCPVHPLFHHDLEWSFDHVHLSMSFSCFHGTRGILIASAVTPHQSLQALHHLTLLSFPSPPRYRKAGLSLLLLRHFLVLSSAQVFPGRSVHLYHRVSPLSILCKVPSPYPHTGLYHIIPLWYLHGTFCSLKSPSLICFLVSYLPNCTLMCALWEWELCLVHPCVQHLSRHPHAFNEFVEWISVCNYFYLIGGTIVDLLLKAVEKS